MKIWKVYFFKYKVENVERKKPFKVTSYQLKHFERYKRSI